MQNNNNTMEEAKWWDSLPESEKDRLNILYWFKPIEEIYKAEHPEQEEESKEEREMRMAYQTADMQDYENKSGVYAENKEIKDQLKKCRNALATSLESNTQTVLMNKREVTALKERIEVLTKALERLNKVAEMYLTNTEKHPDFKMTAESTITQYFKETVAKAKEALNRKA